MEIYLVKQKYFSDGTVNVDVDRIRQDDVPENVFIHTEKYDYYEDYFTSQVEATEFYYEAIGEDAKRNRLRKI